MDIASLSTILSQDKVMSQVGTALLKMNMNNTEEAVKEVTKLIDTNSVDPRLGNIIDATV